MYFWKASFGNPNIPFFGDFLAEINILFITIAAVYHCQKFFAVVLYCQKVFSIVNGHGLKLNLYAYVRSKTFGFGIGIIGPRE